MKKIMFVCHGNICRSPMAEFIMKDIVKKNKKESDYLISSSATSNEEIGNDIYPYAKEQLIKHNISYCKRRAIRFTKNDYETYDYIIAMDDNNLYNLNSIVMDKQHKVYKLKSYLGNSSDIYDPWYSRNFDLAYNEIEESCRALFISLEKNNWENSKKY